MGEVRQFRSALEGRPRSTPWFDVPRHIEDAAAQGMALEERDALFVGPETVQAHLIFALAQRELGARVNLERLESRYDEDLDTWRPVLISTAGAEVSYVNPLLGIAVLTVGNRTETMRCDAVTDIAIVPE